MPHFIIPEVKFNYFSVFDHTTQTLQSVLDSKTLRLSSEE